MTAFVPNTTVRIERNNSAPVTGTAVEGYGPDLSNWTPVATGAPAYLHEDSQTTWDPTADRKTIREVTLIRLRPDAQVQDRDRLVDEQTGAMYQVDTITTESSTVGVNDIRVVTIRITA
jgi:hypothetical protein